MHFVRGRTDPDNHRITYPGSEALPPDAGSDVPYGKRSSVSRKPAVRENRMELEAEIEGKENALNIIDKIIEGTEVSY